MDQLAEMVQEKSRGKVVHICDYIKTARRTQKDYADERQKS